MTERNFRSRETQKVKGLKVTRKVKTAKRKFCIKKTHTFTIIASLREQLKNSSLLNTRWLSCKMLKDFQNVEKWLQDGLFLKKSSNTLQDNLLLCRILFSFASKFMINWLLAINWYTNLKHQQGALLQPLNVVVLKGLEKKLHDTHLHLSWIRSGPQNLTETLVLLTWTVSFSISGTHPIWVRWRSSRCFFLYLTYLGTSSRSRSLLLRAVAEQTKPNNAACFS